MAVVTGKDKICKEISDALGLKHVRKLIINMEVGHIVTVEAEFYPEIDGIRKLPAILKMFNLVEAAEKTENREGEYGLDGPDDKKTSWPEHLDNLKKETSG